MQYLLYQTFVVVYQALRLSYHGLTNKKILLWKLLCHENG